VTPTQTVAQQRAGMQRLAEVVSSSSATFGVRFDPVGERIQVVDEKGALVSDERALLVVLDLVAAERHHGRVALPVTTTRVAEQVCRFHGVQVDWTPTSMCRSSAVPWTASRRSSGCSAWSRVPG
jgi:mannose-1-phosphate guanylyltransferase / phosphomannomutase